MFRRSGSAIPKNHPEILEALSPIVLEPVTALFVLLRHRGRCFACIMSLVHPLPAVTGLSRGDGMGPYLLPVQEEVLSALVEAERSGGVRQPFRALALLARPGLTLMHPGLRDDLGDVSEPDLEALHAAGMINLRREDQSTWRFSVTNRGIQHYEEIKAQQSSATESLELHVTKYLDTDGFQARHPTAHAKWAKAQELLWRSEGGDDSTTIGHLAREAMQEFAYCLPGAGGGTRKSQSLTNLKAALDAAPNLGKTELRFLKALVEYWRHVANLTQRQEHGAEKEGDELNWEDDRRVVLHTAIVMYEVDRALSQ